jgi:hypothetical protein
MSEMDELEILARFDRRLAGIELEVPDPPAWPVRRVLGSTRAVSLAGWTPQSLVALALVAVITAVALLVAIPGFVGRVPAPTLTPPPAFSSPSSISEIVVGSDGLPTSIDGEAVLKVSDALSHAFVAKDATTFLVAGWLADAKAACPVPVPSSKPVLLDTGLCGFWPALVGVPPYGPTGQPTPWWNGDPVLWTIFLPGVSPVEPYPPTSLASSNLAVVLRVHTHDPSAVSCPAGVRAQCEQAVVVNSFEWIPTRSGPVSTSAPYPAPTQAITFRCPPIQLNGLSTGPGTTAWCPPAEVAVEAAVGTLGYPIKTISISSMATPCGMPWPSADSACGPVFENTAFVTFAGTGKVAALRITFQTNGPAVATLIAFQVPPAGWSLP